MSDNNQEVLLSEAKTKDPVSQGLLKSDATLNSTPALDVLKSKDPVQASESPDENIQDELTGDALNGCKS